MPNSQQCKNCHSPFQVTKNETDFLNKISPSFAGQKYQIPTPEICPDCRLIERTIQRNEQFFYQKKSANSGKQLISIYHPNSPYKVLSHEEWWNENWDAQSFGRDFDFNRSFFDQFQELNLQIPRINLIQLNNENCPYSTGTAYCKNCHLINCSENDEDCFYGKLIQSCKDVIDSAYCYDSECLYECFNVKKCYNCKYVYNSQNSYDCSFCDNINQSKNCFLCTNLNGKEYCFKNQQLSKEEYAKKVEETLKPEAWENTKKQFDELRLKRIYKYANIISCENSTGDFLTNCKNCLESYDANDSEDCQYLTVGVNVKDIVDCSNMYLKSELNYQVIGTLGTYNVIFSMYIFHSQNIFYSQFCFNSKDLFGCCGLRNKKYCILNKQYSQSEYEKLLPKIIAHLQKTGEWGKFFSTKTSPFFYNETVANEYLPLNKEEACAKGYGWREINKKDYQKQTFSIPLDIKKVPNSIVNEILACSNCGKNYKIIQAEFNRLKKWQIPIPTKCPDCRYKERTSLRNLHKIYQRNCAKCSLQIYSSFSPSRPEKIYCEKCYLKEVY